MNNIEDRLRDAYRSAALTVSHDGIRQLDEPSVMISLPKRRIGTIGHERRQPPRRMVIPAAAAAAVALTGSLAVVVPQIVPGILASHTTARAGGHHRTSPAATTSPAGRFFAEIAENNTKFRIIQSLRIRNASSGGIVASIAAPRPGLYFSDVATGDGRTYVAVLNRAGVCRSWLYKFRLDDAGQPGPLTPFALAASDENLGSIAISRDNRTFAYLGNRCAVPSGRGPDDLVAVNLPTMRTRHWDVSSEADITALSLTASGHVLAYSIGATHAFSAAAFVLSTDAAPGPAARRSRVVATGAQFGTADTIGAGVIAPDGATLYLTTYATGAASGRNWQLRAVDLATGQSHVVGTYAGTPGSLATDPSASQAMTVVDPAWTPPPPTGSPVPSPSPTRTPQPTPSPAPTGRLEQPRPQLAIFDVATGDMTILTSADARPGAVIRCVAW